MPGPGELRNDWGVVWLCAQDLAGPVGGCWQQGHVLSALSPQGCYFCVKQYALECSRIPMGQSVNSQVTAGRRVLALSWMLWAWAGRAGISSLLPAGTGGQDCKGSG